MKLLLRINPIGVIVMAAVLLSGCGGATGGKPVEATGPDDPTVNGPEWTGVEAADYGLEVILQLSERVLHGQPVTLAFTLTNRSEVGLWVLKWYTPLEGVAGEIFGVARDGHPLAYEGPLVMRGDPTAESYIYLEAGGSASTTVDLATVYDLTRAGTYTVEFLSPRISHVARTGAEMASSVDELGSVAMPGNRVSFRLGQGAAAGGGELVGYIRELYERDGRWRIQFEQIEWLTGARATRALVEDGLCAGSMAECQPPNGFYIRERKDGSVSLPLADQVIVLMQTLSHGPDGNFNWDEPIDLERFCQVLSEEATAHLREVPYQLTLDGGEVAVIGERYMP